jgi:hypothetical protein
MSRAIRTVRSGSASPAAHPEGPDRQRHQLRCKRRIHRIEHRRRHDRLKHLPRGRHIMHFIEIDFSGVVTPTRSAKCAAKKMMTAVTAFHEVE